MARPETLSTENLVDRLAEVFWKKGYEGASLADLAAASSLAKAALYHRFPEGKAAMASAVLSQTERRMSKDVLAPLAARGDPAERLAAMAMALSRFYDGGARSCLVELFTVAGTPDDIRVEVHHGTAEWIAATAAVLVEAGFAAEEARRRSEDAVVRIEGALVVSRALNDRSPFRRVIEGLPTDLLAPVERKHSHPVRKEKSMNSPKTFNQIFGAPDHPSPFDQSALVLIDIQREYVDGAAPLENVQEAAAEAGRLLALAREGGVPVFHIAHGAGPGAPAFATDGPYVEHLPAVAPRDGEPVIWKTQADAFLGTGLADRIRQTGRTEVIIAGDMTHVCVSTSARTAAEAHGFRVTVVGDATAARDLPNPLGGVVPAETVRQAALAELADAFAVVVKDASAWV